MNDQIRIEGAVHYYDNVLQNTDQWHELRSGIITASIMGKLLSPKKLMVSDTAETRKHLYEIAAQRIVNIEVDHFMSFDMERGNKEEELARDLYSSQYEEVLECGFIINNSLGFNIGFSPDGLVRDEGMIENKSRAAKNQVQTIYEYMCSTANTPIPDEFMLQVQTGLFVTGRKWCDFTSYSNGLNMIAIRNYPMEKYQDAIVLACESAEKKIKDIVAKVKEITTNKSARITSVEWVDHREQVWS